jgi:capsular exopolysaccharide synthesis family protein
MTPDMHGWLRLARRRWWIVSLAMVLSGAMAFAYQDRQEVQYAASTTLLIISSVPDTGNQYTTLQASERLADTYRLLIETSPVLDRVVSELNLPYGAYVLGDKISTTTLGETQLVEVTVTDSVPEQAALIANTLADQFQTYITDRIDSRIGAQVEIAEPASIPSEPFAPRTKLWLTLGVFIGLVLGALVVTLLEFLDNTVKSHQDIEVLVGAPVLARVPKSTGRGGTEEVFALWQPRSIAAEAIRLLRTNLEFASATRPIGVLAVSSAGPQEGKSLVAANLAVVMAQAGLRTLLIDADLRKPSQHILFEVENRKGLTTLVMHPNSGWQETARAVAVPSRLSLISSGPIPPNPSDLLQSERFSDLLASIRQEVDYVILDTPPILSVTDALVVASCSDALILVCRDGKTRIDALTQAAQAAMQGNIRVAGVVLNRVKDQRSAYLYSRYYGHSESPPARPPSGRDDITIDESCSTVKDAYQPVSSSMKAVGSVRSGANGGVTAPGSRPAQVKVLDED